MVSIDAKLGLVLARRRFRRTSPRWRLTELALQEGKKNKEEQGQDEAPPTAAWKEEEPTRCWVKKNKKDHFNFIGFIRANK